MCGTQSVGAVALQAAIAAPASGGGVATPPASGAGKDAAGHEGHGHNSILYGISSAPPNANQFINGSLGASAGQKFKLDAGPGFKGKKGRNPNGNDQSQNNLTKADANRSAYGIPAQVAGTNQKPNYVQDIQVGIGMGGLEALRPDILQKLIDNQNAGKGSVWNGVAYLVGLNDQHDGSVPPELEAIRGEIMGMQVGKSGKTLAQWAENPKDSRGNNWARTNHAQTGIKAYLQLEAAGVDPKTANQVANNDDLVSGAGRIDQIAPGRASNNQENTFTGMNGNERKQWAKAAELAKQQGKPEILRIMMDSHTMGSHMLTQFGNKGAKSKINGNLGLDPNLPADQRKAQLVDFFLNNPKDPKKGTAAGGAGGAKAAPAQAGAAAPAVAQAAGGCGAAQAPPPAAAQAMAGCDMAKGSGALQSALAALDGATTPSAAEEEKKRQAAGAGAASARPGPTAAIAPLVQKSASGGPTAAIAPLVLKSVGGGC